MTTKYIHPDDYAFDHTSMAAVAAGIRVLPSMVERYPSGNRLWKPWTPQQERAAIRNVHCIVGCLDAPLDDHTGTA